MNETFTLETLWNAIASPFVILSNKLFGGAVDDLNVEAAADLNVEAAADLNVEAADAVQQHGFAREFCVHSILYGCFFGAGLMLGPVRNECVRIDAFAYNEGWHDSWKKSLDTIEKQRALFDERCDILSKISYNNGYRLGLLDCSIPADNIDQCAENHTVGMDLRF